MAEPKCMNFSTRQVDIFVGETECRMVLTGGSAEDYVIDSTSNPDLAELPELRFYEVAFGTSWWCPVLGCGIQVILGLYMQGVFHVQGW